MPRQRAVLTQGRLYEHPTKGVCECLRVGPSRATLRPLARTTVTVPADPSSGRDERTFTSRGRAFDVAPSSILRGVR